MHDTAWMTNVPWKVDGRAVALEFGLSSRAVAERSRVDRALGRGAAARRAARPAAGRAEPRGQRRAAGGGHWHGPVVPVQRRTQAGPRAIGRRACRLRGAHIARVGVRRLADAEVRPSRSRDGRLGHRPDEPLSLHPRQSPVRAARRRPATGFAEDRLRTCARPTSCRYCIETMAIFRSAYGAEAGNLAVRTVATRGLYIGGGIAPKNIALLERPAFIAPSPRRDRCGNCSTDSDQDHHKPAGGSPRRGDRRQYDVAAQKKIGIEKSRNREKTPDALDELPEARARRVPRKVIDRHPDAQMLEEVTDHARERNR